MVSSLLMNMREIKKRLGNRKEVLNKLKRPKTANVVYIDESNSLLHELVKTILFYYIKKRKPIEAIIQQIDRVKAQLEIVEDEMERVLSRFPKEKGDVLILTEAEVGKDKVDILIADLKTIIEVDYHHKTKKEKVERLIKEEFNVVVYDLK